MAQLRHHYERAFESYLRMRRAPYIAVDEIRRAVLPPRPALSLREGTQEPRALKSFDFVVYGDESRGESHLLIELKGRKVAASRARKKALEAEGLALTPPPAARARRAECWATASDISSLTDWQRLFGPRFRAALVFVYWCDQPLPGALYHDTFRHRERWYAARAIALDDYARAMKVRSPKWQTVDLAPDDFEKLSRPFTDRRPIPLLKRAAEGMDTARVRTSVGIGEFRTADRASAVPTG